jgi:ketosteroid isomerase-like protein
MTQDIRSPVEVFERLVAGVCRLVAGDADQVSELVALYAEPTRVEHPMSPRGIPPLLSRDDLRRHFSAAGIGPTPITDYRASDVVVHETADPEVIVVEFRYLGTVDGRAFQVPCVFVTRVRDGLIVESRDYIDSAELREALDAPVPGRPS